MKKMILTLAVITLLGGFPNAYATDEYERYFFTSNDKMYVTDIEFNVLQVVDLPSYTEAMTFDGERWWMIYNDSEVYAFDLNGDYVTSFPAPRSGIRGMAWDGDCIWMVASDDPAHTYYFYERYPDGTIGPHGDFSHTDEDEWNGEANGLAYRPGETGILAIIDVLSYEAVFDRDGNFYYYARIEHYLGGPLDNCRGYCFADTDYDYGFGPGPFSILICDPWRTSDNTIYFAIISDYAYGPYGIPGSEGDGSGVEYARIQYEKLDEESFGRIKAFFTDK
jgi:hypothetical protein